MVRQQVDFFNELSLLQIITRDKVDITHAFRDHTKKYILKKLKC